MAKGIYIMTNPSFPNFIKIGYSDDIERRCKDLSNTSVPYPFIVYAIYETKEALSDKNLHNLIDKLRPDLRVTKNREFYIMEKEDAYILLLDIAIISGTKDKLKLLNISDNDKENEEQAEEIETSMEDNKEPFKFHMCNIKIGETITFFNDDNVVAEVIDDKSVKYNGKNYSLSGLAKKLLGVNYGVRGPSFFRYKGKILKDLRNEIEGKSPHPQRSLFEEDNKELTIIPNIDKNFTKQQPKEYTKRPPLKFSMLGIKKGDVLTFCRDETIKVTVKTDSTVIYKGEEYALSPLAKVLLHRKSAPQGQEFFTFNGKKLTQLRDEIEGKINK